MMREEPHHSGRRRRVVLRVLIGVGLIAAMILWLEKFLLFHPVSYPEGVWDPPGLEFKDVWFETADGVKLHGWYVESEKPAGHIIYFHGNAGNLSHRYELIRELHRRLGLSVLIFDYRGYGRSEGGVSGSGLLPDARAALAWYRENVGVKTSAITLLGRSLGGGVAVALAAEHKVRALILEATFDSLVAVGSHHFPWLPVRWLMRTRLPSEDLISRFPGPKLFVHGTEDQIVPIKFGESLFAAAEEPKTFLRIDGYGHNDSWPESYYRAVADLLAVDRSP